MKNFYTILFVLLMTGSASAQIHYAGSRYIEGNISITTLTTPAANFSFVKNYKNRQYVKYGISYMRNSFTFLAKDMKTNILLAEVPYFINLLNEQKIYLNIGAGVNIGCELTPDRAEYTTNNFYELTPYPNKFLIGGQAIVEGEFYITPYSALVLNIKGLFINSDINKLIVATGIGIKFQF